ncbi:purine permease [Haloechinothrix sp. LS1_15]|nr:purine permease [Haloechinothrix sp. LS1_15]
MYAGVVTPPIIVGGAVGLSTAEMGILVSAALLVSGLATLLQTLGVWRFGAKLPVVIGISFVPVTAMTAIAEDSGLPVVFGATIISGLFGLALIPFMASLRRFFPPVVTGCVITVIGLSLFPVAVGWIMDNGSGGEPATGNLALAGATLVIVLVLARVLPGALNKLAVLGGLVLGTAIAALFGMADFGGVTDGPVFSLGQPFYFGTPEFQIAAIVTMCIVMLVILAEGIADILAVGEIVGSKVSSRRLADGLRADVSAAIFGPLLNSFPGSTFSQNVGLIALTRIKSRFVVAVGGLILITLGLFPILGRVVAAIPMPVLGGAGLVLFGSVAAAGIRTLAKVNYENNLNLVIVAVSLGFGIIPIAAPEFYETFPDALAMILHSGIVGGFVAALVLNLCFNVLGGAGGQEQHDEYEAGGTTASQEAAPGEGSSGRG